MICHWIRDVMSQNDYVVLILFVFESQRGKKLSKNKKKNKDARTLRREIVSKFLVGHIQRVMNNIERKKIDAKFSSDNCRVEESVKIIKLNKLPQYRLHLLAILLDYATQLKMQLQTATDEQKKYNNTNKLISKSRLRMSYRVTYQLNIES